MQLNIYSPINKLGYGQHAYGYINALLKYYEINHIPIGQIQCEDYEFLNKLKKDFDRNIPSIMIFHENYVNQFIGKPLIAYPVFEGTIIDEYSKKLLSQLDYIFVTSKWAKQVLLNNNIKSDDTIFVIREGVDYNKYNIKDSKYIDTGKFTFITVGKHEVRKNTDLIIETFIDEFRDKECALIAHTYNIFTKKFTGIDPTKKGFLLTEDNDKYFKFTYGDCDIYFTKPIENKDLSDLYNSANIGIFPSRTEGWNLGLIESLACGLPCIATNITGQSEYLDSAAIHDLQGILLIEKNELKLEPMHDGVWFNNGEKGEWYVISPELLRNKISIAYSNYDKFNKKDISSHIINNFKWEFCADKTKEVLDAICKSSI